MVWQNYLEKFLIQWFFFVGQNYLGWEMFVFYVSARQKSSGYVCFFMSLRGKNRLDRFVFCVSARQKSSG